MTSLGASAQGSVLFDGDFESGTFQGWTPGGENGGFASVAAKGGCYSGNDTTAISFNGNPTSNYAALLRSNAAGDTDSIATLRSRSFTAGNGLLFSALSETLDRDPGHRPVNFVVRIISGDGSLLAELPYRTAIIQLTKGCPSEARDAGFSQHFIDTHHFAGQEISIEFAQNTNHESLGYFTLIDNVLFVDQGTFLLSTSQPIAVAGTGLTTSGTFFLDPRASIDPDDAPESLSYSWFINGESSIRELDIPCVNLNSDFELEAGNNIATLYVNDGFNYAADTIRFVIPAESAGTGDSSNGQGDSQGSGQTTSQGTDQANGQNNDQNSDQSSDQASSSNDGQNSSDFTLTDPANECDVDLAEIIANGDDNNGSGGDGTNTAPEISVGTDTVVNFAVGGTPTRVANTVTISDADNDDIVFVTVSIQNPETGDGLTLPDLAGLQISGSGGTSITIAPSDANDPAQTGELEAAVERIEFEYLVPSGGTPSTSNRTISYLVSDGDLNSQETTSIVDVTL